MQAPREPDEAADVSEDEAADVTAFDRLARRRALWASPPDKRSGTARQVAVPLNPFLALPRIHNITTAYAVTPRFLQEHLTARDGAGRGVVIPHGFSGETARSA